jgi:4-diphosphocytidyl-2-C-methyl-D-erythritol kinase
MTTAGGGPMTKPAVIEAPAKLTLELTVVGVRPDGMHLLDAEMVTVDLADRLELSEGEGLTVECDFRDAVPAGASNLITRALAAVEKTAQVRLVKHIPPGGGLGGGSADAAAVLRWAGQHDLGLAASLGADVPFCLVGGYAEVTGIGEEVTPLAFEAVEGLTYTLLTPPFGVSTQSVYATWDRLGGVPAEGPNDLEPAALVVEPRLAEWRDRLGEATGETPVGWSCGRCGRPHRGSS